MMRGEPHVALPRRRPRASEAKALLEFVGAGIHGYRVFAPEGWEPPWEATAAKTQRTAAELDDPATYSLVVEAMGRLVGFVHSCASGALAADVHLRFLFVDEAHWGTGLAHDLHSDWAEAQSQRSATLFTPRDHTRARRFYERRGWLPHATSESSELGLALVEYRRPGRGTERCGTP